MMSKEKPNFVTERQFLRARKIIRKICYRKTMNKKTGKYGYVHKPPSSSLGLINIEGHLSLKIQFPVFKLEKGGLEKLEEIEEIEEQDSIWIDDGRADGAGSRLIIDLRPEEEAD